jgi:toxin ParE1/3/4
MTARSRSWPVRLAAAAEVDFHNILLWTAERFGAAQARVYAETLSMALEALAAGPTVSGAKARDDIARGVFTLHVARRGRKGRHFVVFRIGRHEGGEVIDVLRLLHDSMDLPRHVPPADETT